MATASTGDRSIAGKSVFEQNPKRTRITHAGLASGESTNLGRLVMASGSVGAGLLLYNATSSLGSSTHFVAGGVTEYWDPDAGTAASSNGDNSRGLVVEATSMWFKNAANEAVASAFNAQDVGKLAYVINNEMVGKTQAYLLNTTGSLAGRCIGYDSVKNLVLVDLTERDAARG